MLGEKQWLSAGSKMCNDCFRLDDKQWLLAGSKICNDCQSGLGTMSTVVIRRNEGVPPLPGAPWKCGITLRPLWAFPGEKSHVFKSPPNYSDSYALKTYKSQSKIRFPSYSNPASKLRGRFFLCGLFLAFSWPFGNPVTSGLHNINWYDLLTSYYNY